MRTRDLSFLILFFILALPGRVLAHPVSFKGSVGVMPEYSPKRQDLEVNYSLSAQSAVGVSTVHLDLEDSQAQFYLPRFNYRLYRQNELESQTNVYIWGGAGVLQIDDDNRLADLAGFQADYETRRIYTLALGETLGGEGGVDYNRVRYRLGVAPYLADFDGFHTWLIGQVEYTPQTEDEWTVTPLVRFFYRNYLVEVGSSTRGEMFVAGIFHF